MAKEGTTERRNARIPAFIVARILLKSPARCKVLWSESLGVRKELRCHTLTLSPLDPLVSLWLLVPLACRFYFGPDIRFAHARIPGKLCTGRYGSQAGRFVSLSGPGRSSIHTVRISQAFLYLTLTT